MENRERVYEALVSKVTKSTTHLPKVIDYYQNHRMELIKKSMSIPLIGNGAGLLLCANGIIRLDGRSDFIALVLPTTWLYLVGVFLAALSIIWANQSVLSVQNSNIAKFNSMSLLNEVKDKLKLHVSEEPSKIFAAIQGYESDLIDTIVEDSLMAKKLNKKSKFWRKMSIRTSITSLIFFGLATLVVLIPLSLSYDFVLFPISQ